MLDTVTECLVSRNITTGDIAKRAAMVCLDVLVCIGLSILGGYFPSMIMVFLIIIGAMIFLTYLVFRNTDVEYEYQFLDGELQIDKVMHKQARKKMKSFDMKKMEYMAPVGSQHLGGLSGQRKQYDFSANDEEKISYVAVLADDEGNSSELKFTPDENLLSVLDRACPRKVYKD